MATRSTEVWDKFKNVSLKKSAPDELIVLTKNAFYLGIAVAMEPYQDLKNKKCTNEEAEQQLDILNLDLDTYLTVASVMNQLNKKSEQERDILNRDTDEYLSMVDDINKLNKTKRKET